MAMRLPLMAKHGVALIVASIAMWCLTGRILESDASAPAIRSFVTAHEQVIAVVGAVKDVKIVKRIEVSATETAKAYRLYTVDVRGATASTSVIVRFEGGSGDEAPTLESVIR